MALPIVDISPFVGDGKEADRKSCSDQLMKAASEQGFFYITNHGVSEDLLTEAIAWSNRFFSLPLEAKKEIDVTLSRSCRGYQSLGTNVTKGRPDRHEGVDLYKDTEEPPDDFQGPTNMGRNQWLDESRHQSIRGFRDFWEKTYVPAMLNLGRRVMEAFSIGLGLPADYFLKFYDESFWVMRMIHYPWVLPEDLVPGELGCGVHTDYGCVTLLLSDDTRGCLQAQNLDGEWVTVEPLVQDGRRAFVVNLGDMLEKWTGGKVRATPHRVLPAILPVRGKTAKSGRISVPFFFEPNYDAVIKPLFPDSNSKQVESIVYGDHLLSKTSSNFSFQERSRYN